jgi:hypothetical protein
MSGFHVARCLQAKKLKDARRARGEEVSDSEDDE